MTFCYFKQVLARLVKSIELQKKRIVHGMAKCKFAYLMLSNKGEGVETLWFVLQIFVNRPFQQLKSKTGESGLFW